jgi:hypothetical protein
MAGLWHAPTAIPACLRKISSSEGRASCSGEWEGGVTPPSICSSSSSTYEDSGSEGVSSPHPGASPPSGRHSKPASCVSAPSIAH